MKVSKETIKGLIANSQKTIEDLYGKVCGDNKKLRMADEFSPRVLVDALELRRDIRYAMIDMLTSLRACLGASHYVEKCFHLKNLESIRVEAFSLLFGFAQSSEYSTWNRLGFALHDRCVHVEDNNCQKIYSEILTVYEQVISLIEKARPVRKERKSRNLTYHYDEELLQVYSQLVNVQKAGEDEPSKKMVPWMDLLLVIQMLCELIEKVENAHGNGLPNMYSGSRNLNLSSLVLKKMAGEFNKKNDMKEVLMKALDNVSNIDWAALQRKRLLWVQDWISEGTHGKETPSAVTDIATVLNVYIMIGMLFADIASTMNGFMRAGCDIEFPLLFRRLTIAKCSALSHLAGYDDYERSVALWPLVVSSIPKDEPLLLEAGNGIGNRLDSLVYKEDVKRRALYVHLMDRYSHRSNVPDLLSCFDGIGMLADMQSHSVLIKTLGDARKFLEKLLKTLLIKADETAKENDRKMREQLGELRQLIHKVVCEDDVKNSLYKMVEEMEEKFCHAGK